MSILLILRVICSSFLLDSAASLAACLALSISMTALLAFSLSKLALAFSLAALSLSATAFSLAALSFSSFLSSFFVLMAGFSAERGLGTFNGALTGTSRLMASVALATSFFLSCSMGVFRREV